MKMIRQNSSEQRLIKLERSALTLAIELGIRPLTTAEVMKARLDHKLSYDEAYYSSDAIVYDSNGNFKIIIDSDLLKESVNSQNQFGYGTSPITQEQYQELEGTEFYKSGMPSIKRLKFEEVGFHPGWLELAQGDEGLLRDYTSEVFRLSNELYNINVAMGFCIRNPEKVPTIGAWCISSVRFGSDVLGGSLHSNAYFVGLQEGYVKQDDKNANEIINRTKPVVNSLEAMIKGKVIDAGKGVIVIPAGVLPKEVYDRLVGTKE